ncbi:MAG: hypothetical protein IPH38_20880 [Candidatus Microthrix sp.]|nr:hypothetical protein [Candidatus Microthrix sp.]MBK7021956.1 hypothetical protein [Candidatus Microthrix sp.]
MIDPWRSMERGTAWRSGGAACGGDPTAAEEVDVVGRRRRAASIAPKRPGLVADAGACRHPRDRLARGIAIDLSAAHLAQRRLVQVTERAADDAAGMLDSDSLRSGGPARVSPGAAQNLARLQVSAFDVPALQNTGTVVSIGRDGRSVTVSTTATVRRLFGAALPGVAPHLSRHGSGHGPAGVTP